jgi:NADH:ubiquinone oxidoreductase subunit 2 (subunit N)
LPPSGVRGLGGRGSGINSPIRKIKKIDFFALRKKNISMKTPFLNLFENDFLAIFPELFLGSCSLILLIYGVSLNNKKMDTAENARSADVSSNQRMVIEEKIQSNPILVENVGWIGLYALGFTLLLVINNPLNNTIFFYNSLILDDFTFFFKCLLLIGCIFTLVISFDYLKKEGIAAFEYIVLLLLSVTSMLLMISSYDFLSMYLTIEFQSLCFYVIAAFKRNSEFSTEAGLKYFLLGAFSSGILLFGTSILYGFTGITNFEELTKFCLSPVSSLESGSSHVGTGVTLGMLFITVGFLFKLTAAPFHMWAPDVYEGSPTSVTAFFSVAPKIAILALFTRLFLYTGPFGSILEKSYLGGISSMNQENSILNGISTITCEKILVFCSIASMLVGAFSALSQQKIKRLLAYSSIGHIGYILIGLTCGTPEGIESLLVYLIIYIIMTLNVFAIILSLRSPVASHLNSNSSLENQTALQQIGFQPSTTQIRYISDLNMLAKTNPVLAISLTITLFSMAGIPPLAGFCGKFYVFFSALSSSFYVLAFVGIFTSLVSCFYYIRLIKVMYFEKPSGILLPFEPIDKAKSLVLAFTLFFLLFFVFYPSPVFLMAHKVALSVAL